MICLIQVVDPAPDSSRPGSWLVLPTTSIIINNDIHGHFGRERANTGVCGRALVSRGFEPLAGGRQGRRELPLECVEALLRLLSIPLRSLGLAVLSLAEYVDLLHFLPWESQKQVGALAAGRVFAVCIRTRFGGGG